MCVCVRVLRTYVGCCVCQTACYVCLWVASDFRSFRRSCGPFSNFVHLWAPSMPSHDAIGYCREMTRLLDPFELPKRLVAQKDVHWLLLHPEDIHSRKGQFYRERPLRKTEPSARSLIPTRDGTRDHRKSLDCFREHSRLPTEIPSS